MVQAWAIIQPVVGVSAFWRLNPIYFGDDKYQSAYVSAAGSAGGGHLCGWVCRGIFGAWLCPRGTAPLGQAGSGRLLRPGKGRATLVHQR